MVYGKQWASLAWQGSKRTKKDRMAHLATLKPVRIANDHLIAEVDGYIENFIFFDGDAAVTGNGGDPIYIFVRNDHELT